ncbi:hypothetical protein BpHYR1_039875 [Brachionus plicatilis]|uniref:Uncharacterized protein n=1 Tax=Brachionus plicatilis TaxID=10195 RepID=A0A3M7P3A7_BRAPC|nr:hypothetical protein BpHYR1_039875 [Brachionus plicatilis]
MPIKIKIFCLNFTEKPCQKLSRRMIFNSLDDFRPQINLKNARELCLNFFDSKSHRLKNKVSEE